MAREQSQGDIVIIARTDALQKFGYEVAVKRLKLAILAGADVAFLGYFTTVEQGKQVCKDLAPTPLMLNMVAGGVTPSPLYLRLTRWASGSSFTPAWRLPQY